MIEELKDVKKAEALFSGWQDSVVWAAVQGVMGSIYVDSLENPRSGAVLVAPVMYGYPTYEAFELAEQGKLVLGGCKRV